MSVLNPVDGATAAAPLPGVEDVAPAMALVALKSISALAKAPSSECTCGARSGGRAGLAVSNSREAWSRSSVRGAVADSTSEAENLPPVSAAPSIDTSVVRRVRVAFSRLRSVDSRLASAWAGVVDRVAGVPVRPVDPLAHAARRTAAPSAADRVMPWRTARRLATRREIKT